MALLQISEPGQSPEPHASKRKPALGIDLGTTHSLVATVTEQGTQMLTNQDGEALLPSIVYYGENGIEVGEQAKLKAAEDPLNTISSIKRLMGKSDQDIARDGHHYFPYDYANREGNVIAIKTRIGTKTAVEVSADILRQLAARGRQSLGEDVQGVVITVPAYFDDAQRQATKDAARLAGLPVMRLLNEPTAAAVAYGLDQQEESVIAVYDLGGGTFDISILRLSKGVFQVLATGGNSSLGGDDFDWEIVRWLCEQWDIVGKLPAAEQRELLTVANTLKHALSDDDEHTVSWRSHEATLNRQQLDELLTPLIQVSLKSCKRALRDAKLKNHDIDHVIMVGGSTRSFCVRDQVETFFGQSPLVTIDPDQVVAMGAAIQADILVGNKSSDELLLLDVLPLSLGLETMGGLVEKIITRNTTIPVSKAQEFTTFKDGQTAMSIHVVQGERELVSDCRSLARFELQDIPPMVAGAAHIRIVFQVDADGLLSVSAEEKSTGHRAEITVKPSYGLDDKTITEMIQDSFANALDDVNFRSLREQQVEAQRMIESLSSALADNGSALLSAEEYDSLNSELQQLKVLSEGNDVDAIRLAIEALSEHSEYFASLRMDASIKQALQGHTLDEIEKL